MVTVRTPDEAAMMMIATVTATGVLDEEVLHDAVVSSHCANHLARENGPKASSQNSACRA